MLISRKWLSQYMDVSDLSIEEMAEKITAAGFEVEGVERLAEGTNLVIGEVLTCEMHPDSDHLHCTTVNVGNEVLNIVCGAPNVAAGQKVIVAKVGAQLPDGEIKAGRIRGQESNGMICSLLELGVEAHTLTEEQKAGIEILPADAPVGHTDVLEYLGYDDEVMNIGLTPNRNDCLAAFNMAMEAGAILQKDVKLPDYQDAANVGGPTKLQIHSDTKGCPSFLGKVVGHITIKESPKWMKELLRASGMNSINNVVDISNIVMLETGQPMHFYDKDAIVNQEITVKDGFEEEYTALDGVTYQLKPSDLVITNQGKPIGIAGIMGGDDSKILDTTKGLIIECAMFDHVSIRNTARRLNLATESSIRYQKGIEPLASQKALDRAVQLLIEYADARDLEETVVYGSANYHPHTIACTLDDINHRLGTSFSHTQVMDVFERLHFEPTYEKDMYTCHIPSHRVDMEGVADLSEEVIRLLGFDSLPSTLPLMEMTEGKLDARQQMVRYIRTLMTQRGLQDCITYTLVSTYKKDNAILSIGDAVELAIPMSEERRYIRTSILPSLLDVVAYNKAHSQKDVNVFEISDVSTKDATRSHLAFALYGQLQTTRWNAFEVASDFYTAKGLVEELLDHIGIATQRITYKDNTVDTEHFHPYRSAVVYIGKDPVAILGQIHPKYGKENDVEGTILCEMDLTKLLEIKKSKIKYTKISKYQSVTRDIALVVNRNIQAAQIVNVIRKQGKLGKEMIIRDIEVTDVYQKAPLPPTVKSITVSILFQSDVQTLKDQQINEVMDQIMKALEKQVGAELRR